MSKIPPIDNIRTVKLIEDFIKIRVSESKLNGVVIGISGGVDSAVTASLAVRALGAEKVHVFFFPSLTTPPGDLNDVQNFCTDLK